MHSSTADASIATKDRKRATRRALLFLFMCAPAWVFPGLLPVGHPAVLVVILLGVTALFLRHDGRGMAVLGLDPQWRRLRELAGGLAGGALLVLAIAALARLLLPFPWHLNADFAWGAAGVALLGYLFGNAAEELIFRGYGFERLIAGIGHGKAQGITALLFALFHVLQGWPWQVALLGTAVASLLFGLVFVRWQSVPAAVGVHVAVNWGRDLWLMDPPTATTLFAPLSPRPGPQGSN